MSARGLADLFEPSSGDMCLVSSTAFLIALYLLSVFACLREHFSTSSLTNIATGAVKVLEPVVRAAIDSKT